MHLIDQVAQCRASGALQHRDGRVYRVTDASDYSARVACCPTRFVLSDALTAACAELAFSTGDRLAGCLDLVRVPAQRVWVEWQDAAALGEMAHVLPPADCSTPCRVGAYLESDECGRAATLRIFWLAPGDDRPQIAPMQVDLRFVGARCEGPQWYRVSDSDASIAELLDCARFKFDDTWDHYYRDAARDDVTRQEVLHHSLGSVARDIPVLMAFFLLLGCRDALSQRREDWRALNRKRSRLGKLKLLEHIEVSLNLAQPAGMQWDNAGGESARRRPRFHHVRGHLVRRRSTLYWRRPHGRGHVSLGAVGSRTVKLHYSPYAQDARPVAEGVGLP